MQLALLTHVDARKAVCVFTAYDANALRRRLAVMPATGYVVAVEVHDPVARTAKWRIVHPLHDGKLRLGSYQTVRGGIGALTDCARLWDAATATAEMARDWSSQMRSLIAFAKTELE